MHLIFLSQRDKKKKYVYERLSIEYSETSIFNLKRVSRKRRKRATEAHRKERIDAICFLLMALPSIRTNRSTCFTLRVLYDPDVITIKN